MKMNNELATIRNILLQNDFTCVISDKTKVLFSSKKRGVTPLIEFIISNDNKTTYFLADKVIGKAAALLCVKANIKYVYTDVISSPAIDIFNNYKIYYEFNKEVSAIQNRDKTGLCPMENLSKGINTPDIMYEKTVIWLKSMNLL